MESEHSGDVRLETISPPKIVERFHSFASESIEDLQDDQCYQLSDSPQAQTHHGSLSSPEKKIFFNEAMKSQEIHSVFETSDIHDHHEHLMVRCTPPTPTLKHLSIHKLLESYTLFSEDDKSHRELEWSDMSQPLSIKVDAG